MASVKSATTVCLDLLRYALILAATAYATLWLWSWNGVVAMIAIVPVYIVALNIFGFLTLPLYLLTPETKRAREMEKALFKRERKQG